MIAVSIRVVGTSEKPIFLIEQKNTSVQTSLIAFLTRCKTRFIQTDINEIKLANALPVN